MLSDIHNSWGEFRSSVDLVLAATRRSLCIFDGNLAELGLQTRERMDALHELLQFAPTVRVRVMLKQVDHLYRDQPRLISLLQQWGHLLEIRQAPDTLLELRDTLVIGDQEHVLVRFDQDHPRSRLILGDTKLSMPYIQRFEDIWAEGGYPFSPTPLGL